jgi:hypothetical protein
MAAPRSLRRVRRIVHVFTEGEVTEPEYFDWLKRQQSQFALKVDDRHAPPHKLVELAIDLQRRSRGRDAPEYDSIWCVFDRDRHPAVDDVVRKAVRAGISVAFSHPCFEYWVLLHFCDDAAPCAGNCADAASKVERYLPGYQKSLPMDRLSGRFLQAKRRALRVAAQHDRDGVILPARQDPSTDVWRIADHIGVAY